MSTWTTWQELIAAALEDSDLEDELVNVFLVTDTDGTWWLFDGYTRRAVGPGENQTLQDLGLVKDAHAVKRVDADYLRAIPVCAEYVT